MRRFLPTVALVLTFFVPPPLEAQEGSTVFVAYYECNISLEAALDAAVMSSIAPIYDRHVESGQITTWGWSAHSIGGPWRRLGFFIAPDRAAALSARASILAAVQEEAPGAADLVNSVCPTHEDYLWTVGQASALATPGGSPMPSMSMYYSCSQGTEASADAAMVDAAPVLEDLVREGRLSNWSWLVHDAGGWFRRAAVFSGSDHASIMSARDELVSRLADSEAVGALANACGSHVDYAWSPVNGN